jgi:protein-S-isoprenylcysteine O-methyltransferase Ste14
MFARALFAFMVCPGIFAGALPWLLAASDQSRGNGSPIGAAVAACGLVVLLWCARDFYVAGRGTLAPWDPPKTLVVVGLYRFVRNPMYLGVLMLVGGWGLCAGSSILGVYALSLALGFHMRVVLHEERWLTRQFAADWRTYSANVRRWLPRATPWRG